MKIYYKPLAVLFLTTLLSLPALTQQQQYATQEDFASFIDPVSRFDPQGTANPQIGYKVRSMVVRNDNGRFTVSF